MWNRVASVVKVAIASLASAGFGCAAYSGGTFVDREGPMRGSRATVGCIDVAMRWVHDAGKPGEVVQYSFGNRCDHAATVDLGATHVVARDASGGARGLVAYDPRAEIRALQIGAGWSGRERVEYRDDSRQLVAAAPNSICLDVSGIAGAARTSGPDIICVNREEEP